MVKKRKKVRGRSRYLIYWFLGLVILYFFFNKIVSISHNMKFFNVTKIDIIGSRYLSQDFLKSVSQSYLGKNIFDVSTREIETLYNNVIRVKSVKCRKILPSGLRITITERVGVFFIRNTKGEFYPIDIDKMVLDKADSYLKEDLPFVNLSISDEVLVPGNIVENQFLDYVFVVYNELLKSQASVISDISEFYFRNNILHFVDIESGSRVMIGTEDIPSQIKRFLFLRQNQGFEKQSFVDLRFTNQIIVR